ncbi:MAG: fructose-bisphosphate aldolase [Candidatus Tectomicrobia bacterium]|uniref:Fructose-bisphosphate aldolase n=1 Tax=Tectimicrobiota bacterium TaxID=2528274 RepID=A0A932GR59_UNCTE|nr:fructose-bisphosphate aldolase [Candidatus Tectomicrobia bacterium]
MKGTVSRPTLSDLDLSPGKRVRLHRLLYEHGPGNGTLLVLPIDQGLEHGPRDFFPNPDSADPEFQFRLAKEGGYSGIALHFGLAQKYLRGYEGDVPIILKLNGKTEVPSDEEAFSPLTGAVTDAVRLGADAVGYTLYVGSPAQDRDIAQFKDVRRQAERYGMPLIVWAYPRGRDIEKKGGRNSLYAIDYAARVAAELGADVIKLNLPVANPEKDKNSPAPYKTIQWSPEEMVRQVIRSAGKALVIISGGEKMSDEELLEKARTSMESGATGFIFGRNLWQRPFPEAMKITQQLKSLLKEFGS